MVKIRISALGDQKRAAALLFFLPTICFILCPRATQATNFTLVNHCDYTVWPGLLGGATSTVLADGGFELPTGHSRHLVAPAGWSGRMWGRTGCTFSSSGWGTCLSGDCGGHLHCQGAGGESPATLIEITLGTQVAPRLDFYDVSLVDGYNLPVSVTLVGGKGNCTIASCAANFNGPKCPKALQVVHDDNVVACKSACLAFGTDEFCCVGSFGNPSTCKPSSYSKVFKEACPNSYSYAFDDRTSVYTCANPKEYTIVFCPNSSRLDISGQVQSRLYNTDARNIFGGPLLILLFLFTWIFLWELYC